MEVRPAVLRGNAAHDFRCEARAVLRVGHDNRFLAALFIADEEAFLSCVDATVREVGIGCRAANLEAESPISLACGHHLLCHLCGEDVIRLTAE